MKEKFTPGPWVACGAESVKIGGVEVGPCLIVSTGLGDDHRDICCITSKAYIEDGDIANAHIIATAPDMYEALKERFKKTCGHEYDCICADEMARAALAKAEGAE